MQIKQIHIEKSRTIKVEGIISRDSYRKITVGMVADLEDNDLEMNTKGEVLEKLNELSSIVDDGIRNEAKKLNKLTKK